HNLLYLTLSFSHHLLKLYHIDYEITHPEKLFKGYFLSDYKCRFLIVKIQENDKTIIARQHSLASIPLSYKV
ncbi:hypothetical protein, partial [Escherichia coli]|uniref:hypothetical protein n=1 Tax=Escherichia coli TaxID=562 RepID=UPI00289F351D